MKFRSPCFSLIDNNGFFYQPVEKGDGPFGSLRFYD